MLQKVIAFLFYRGINKKSRVILSEIKQKTPSRMVQGFCFIWT